MGLGPNGLRVGDIVCVCYGLNVLYILSTQNGYYLLVGEAYMHKIMRGEAFTMCEA